MVFISQGSLPYGSARLMCWECLAISQGALFLMAQLGSCGCLGLGMLFQGALFLMAQGHCSLWLSSVHVGAEVWECFGLISRGTVPYGSARFMWVLRSGNALAMHANALLVALKNL